MMHLVQIKVSYALSRTQGMLQKNSMSDCGMGLVGHVTVMDKDNIVLTFKNGLETKVS